MAFENVWDSVASPAGQWEEAVDQGNRAGKRMYFDPKDRRVHIENPATGSSEAFNMNPDDLGHSASKEAA